MNTQLTLQAKETMFSEYQYIIDTIYFIAGGKILYAQLIYLLEEMEIANKSKAQIKSGITELIKANFLKKKQVLASNSNMLILTSYPLSKILQISSQDVPEIACSRKAILDGICRVEFIINELHSYRIKNKIIGEISINKILNMMYVRRKNTVCVPLKVINKYMKNLSKCYGTLLSDEFREDYKYLEVIRMQKANALSKNELYDIDPDWIKIKDLRVSLQETMSTENQNRSFYTFYNLKNSSCDISHLVIEDDGRMHIKVNLYDNGNLTLDRITSLTSYIFLMFSKYTIHFEKPMIYIYVLCSCEDTKKDLEIQATKRIQNFYGMRDATALTQGLVQNGIRVQFLENIEIIFENLSLDENYHIYY